MRHHFVIMMLLVLQTGRAQEQASSSGEPVRPALPRCSVFEAAHHLGDVASVRGMVREVYTSAKGMVILTFGGAFPDQVFAVVVPDVRGFGSFKYYRGSTVEVTGKVQSYRGTPEIIVSSRRQIVFRESASDPTKGGMGGP